MPIPGPQYRLSRRTVIIAPALALVACRTPEPAPSSVPGEVEATEFQGTALTPVAQQRTNALAGTKVIDQRSYTMTIDGLVDRPLTLDYADLLAREQQSWLMDLNCVEGWSFTGKWTGPSLAAILTEAGAQPDAKVAIFYTADLAEGYTSLDLDFVLDNDLLLGMKINDLTLPAARGFPCQVVAKTKYGYKWAKWITRIELSADTEFRGYWEARGFSQAADDTGPRFD